MILGLRTALYPVPDLAAGKAWYAAAFETQPYFEEPFYVGFQIGGFELGLIPDGCPGTAGALAMWGVPDITKELERLVALGATVIEGATDVGGGIIVATLGDPFGNAIGLIYNPYFNVEAVK